jgi:hypothetical protein
MVQIRHCEKQREKYTESISKPIDDDDIQVTPKYPHRLQSLAVALLPARTTNRAYTSPRTCTATIGYAPARSRIGHRQAAMIGFARPLCPFVCPSKPQFSTVIRAGAGLLPLKEV